MRGVELDLHLHILGDGEQRCRRLVHQHLARLVQRIDVSRHAIAVLRQRLHQPVVVIAVAEAEHGQVNAGLPLGLDEALQLLGIGDADVEIAIGRQDDAVDGALVEIHLGQVVGVLQPAPPAVEPPASSLSSTSTILPRSATRVGSSATPDCEA